MDADGLLRCGCWFGGGTALVLEMGEYRLSKDIDFLCANQDGYRELRSRVVAGGSAALFKPPVVEERAFRSDQYGIRGWIRVSDAVLRVEIVREGRITLEGQLDPKFKVPKLTGSDQVAEKLLANADRCQDRAFAYRDAIDLGMIAVFRGALPIEGIMKAEAAYGTDIRRKLDWVVDRLHLPEERAHAADVLGMQFPLVDQAVDSLTSEAARAWS